jgi:hypothetical protein
MDSVDPVVKLCIAGMQAEGRGNAEEARRLFALAWSESTNAFEGCVAAHYLARHQPNQVECLSWNLKALELARMVEDGSTTGYLPSLLLNVAHSYEMLGDFIEAGKRYREAGTAAIGLVDDGYGRFVRIGIESGLQRIAEHLSDGDCR